MEKIKLSEHHSRLKEPEAFTQLHFIYSQAVAYARIHKQPIDFTIEDVSVWIDEVGEEPFIAEIIKINETLTKKNLTAQKEP